MAAAGPGRPGWSGSAADVAAALRNYRALGITHFVLSDTPYLPKIARPGEQLLPLLRKEPARAAPGVYAAEAVA